MQKHLSLKFAVVFIYTCSNHWGDIAAGGQCFNVDSESLGPKEELILPYSYLVTIKQVQ